MKFFALFLGFSLGLGHAQTNAQIAFVTTAPSGSCAARASLRLRTPNGTLYSCQSGTWATVGASTSPASPINSVQFNSSGNFGGDANLTWDNTNKRMLIQGKLTADVVFTGSGLNDLTASYAQSGGGQQCDTALITVTSGTPDTFAYSCRAITQTTGVAITGGNQYLGDGLTIHFGAATGHTSTNSWDISIQSPNAYAFQAIVGGTALRANPLNLSLGDSLVVTESYTDVPQPQSGLIARLFGMEYDGGKTGMTQPLVSFDFLPHTVDSGSVTKALGPRIGDQTVGTSANCNLVVGSNSDAACPAGDWEIYGTTVKPSHLGGALDAPSITITGSSFSFNGKTCTIIAGAIACS